MPSRREFLRLLALGVAGHTLDVDRLLWVPGRKTIFLPPVSPIQGISISAIVADEMARILPNIKQLFERDDTFYKAIEKSRYPILSSRDMKIPLSFGRK
jgi:hypothetical protein